MRILLVNMSFRLNHGGILQSYALQHLLEGWGHSVIKEEMYPWQEFHFSFHQMLVFLKRCVLRFILRQPIDLLPEWKLDRNEYVPRKYLVPFVRKYIHTIDVHQNLSELDGSLYDAVIVGSDQVWRRQYTWGLLTDKSQGDNAFLAFTRDWHCRRIAYAVSFGKDCWEYTDEETWILQPLIRLFDAVSVREDSAIDLIHQHLDVSIPVEHVLDPTLLIPREDYVQLVRKARTHRSSGNLLLYILDESDSKRQFIEQFASQHNFIPFYVNNPRCEDETLPPEERIQVPIEQWLRGFMEAEFVIADSFHACVFSLIFEKPFLVLLNPERGNTRMESLMRMFNLTDHIVDANHLSLADVPEIDWKIVADRKAVLRKQSIQFLQYALRTDENK